MDLGSVEAAFIERDTRAIHDDQLEAYPNAVAQRLLTHLPPSGISFHVTLVDSAVLNSFSIAGGRIYLTRKMVAFLRSNDELAALIGHEMGHILAQQDAMYATRLFHDIAHADSVTDRQDIYRKYNEVLDGLARDPKAAEERARLEEANQYQADQIGIYAMAAAGYSTQAFADLFDRTAQTKSNTGDRLTDLFGLTTPDEKRLREIRRVVASLPRGCGGSAAPTPSAGFQKWQADVIAYSTLAASEALPGLIAENDLDPPLRTDISHLQFSPDGRYALAQDDGSVFVLSRNPFRLLFRIDASNSNAAQFTPDSQRIVFDTRGLRVEEWSIAGERRLSVHEVTIPEGCIQSRLSPDGKFLACLNGQFDISLVDVATSESVFSKPRFFATTNLSGSLLVFLNRSHPDWILMAFSPDAKRLVCGWGAREFALDVASRAVVPLRGELQQLEPYGLTFLSPDRVVMRNFADPDHSAILEFPSGKVIERIPIGPQTMQAVGKGNYIILRPAPNALAGLFDLHSQQFVLMLRKLPAADFYDQDVIAQETAGEVELFNIAAKKVEGTVLLPRSTLGGVRAGEVSPDLQWLALSAQTRGGVWNMSSAHQVYLLSGFDGAYFDGDRAMYSDFPAIGSQARNISRVDLSRNSITPDFSVATDEGADQFANYLLVRKPLKQGYYSGIALEVHDVRDDHLLWAREFPKEAPQIRVNPSGDSLVLFWPMFEDAAKAEIKNDPVARTRLAGIRDAKTAYLLDVLDLKTGADRGKLLVDTGNRSFGVEGATAAGDWVFVGDNSSRTHVYSLSTGSERGVIFGTGADPSIEAGMAAAETGPGEITFYGLSNLERRATLSFSAPVTLESFSGDGKRFFVLTANQKEYFFDVAALTHSVPDAATKTLAGAGRH